jgi:uncharacterized membrane protein YvbJ
MKEEKKTKIVMHCPRCGNDRDQDDGHCYFCGTKLKAVKVEIRVCKECGKEAKDKDLYCRKCGNELPIIFKELLKHKL